MRRMLSVSLLLSGAVVLAACSSMPSDAANASPSDANRTVARAQHDRAEVEAAHERALQRDGAFQRPQERQTVAAGSPPDAP